MMQPTCEPKQWDSLEQVCQNRLCIPLHGLLQDSHQFSTRDEAKARSTTGVSHLIDVVGTGVPTMLEGQTKRLRHCGCVRYHQMTIRKRAPY